MATGGLAALVQLGILDALADRRWSPSLADAVAILLAAQVNFALSCIVTWYDRRPPGRSLRMAPRWWVAYQGSAVAAGLLNIAVFTAIRAMLLTPVAALVANAVAAVVNYVLNDRFVFRPRSAIAVVRPPGAPRRSRWSERRAFRRAQTAREQGERGNRAGAGHSQDKEYRSGSGILVPPPQTSPQALNGTKATGDDE